MDREAISAPGLFEETRHKWALMTAYQRFEQITALVLSAVIAAVVIIAMFQLLKRLIPLLLGGALDPLDHEVFQTLFGMIMTLLIAMEFKHSIIHVALRHHSIIQVKTVILIALLALSRKFVVLDIVATGPATIAALAFATIALGLVYWLLRDADKRQNLDLTEADAADNPNPSGRIWP